jgi:hypothetical protein
MCPYQARSFLNHGQTVAQVSKVEDDFADFKKKCTEALTDDDSDRNDRVKDRRLEASALSVPVRFKERKLFFIVELATSFSSAALSP